MLNGYGNKSFPSTANNYNILKFAKNFSNNLLGKLKSYMLSPPLTNITENSIFKKQEHKDEHPKTKLNLVIGATSLSILALVISVTVVLTLFRRNRVKRKKRHLIEEIQVTNPSHYHINGLIRDPTETNNSLD
ncbi:hypothetical protein SNEBB_002022 [Seison nebaliae]|nr:hypothetical protein SNEBB_002022 [Seison nebaliae]